MNNYALGIKPVIDNINKNNNVNLTNNTVYDLINQLINLKNQEINMIDDEFTKTKLVYVSSGSNGVVLKELGNDELVYKITLLSNKEELYYQNFIESLYLNYFRINYPDYLECDYFPAQNILTEVISYKLFKESFEFDKEIESKLNYNFIKNDEDIIILNIMSNYKKTLSDTVCEKRKFLLENFDNVVKKILLGINFLHQNNLVHGDIKSTNIMMLENQCKLIDFGGIKKIGSTIYDKTCTLTYRAPEELDYEYNPNSPEIFPNYGFRSEIWSISLVILEIIMGYNPVTQIYNELLISTKGNSREEIDELIEKSLSNMLNSRTHLTINQNFLIRKKLAQFIPKVNVLERALNINPINRHENVAELYFDLFGEKMITVGKSPPTELVYNLDPKLKDVLNIFRKIHYPIIREILLIINKLNCLPLTIHLTDKYLIYLLEKNDLYLIAFIQQLNIESESDMKSDLVLLFLSIILISMAINNRESIMYKDLIILINNSNMLKKKFTLDDIQMVNNSISDVSFILQFDLIDDRYVYNSNGNIIKIMQDYNNMMEKNY